MCIRDRIDAPYTFLNDRLARHYGISGVEGSEFRRVALNTCLLYTSDADDERSSVDLGGRRIIKKKKNDMKCCARASSQRQETGVSVL